MSESPTIVKATKLGAYIARHDGMTQASFAKSVDASRVHIARIVNGMLRASAALAVRIERETGGEVTRLYLRPDLFGDIEDIAHDEREATAA